MNGYSLKRSKLMSEDRVLLSRAMSGIEDWPRSARKRWRMCISASPIAARRTEAEREGKGRRFMLGHRIGRAHQPRSPLPSPFLRLKQKQAEQRTAASFTHARRLPLPLLLACFHDYFSLCHSVTRSPSPRSGGAGGGSTFVFCFG